MPWVRLLRSPLGVHLIQVSKITAAVQSRCTRFRFGPLKKSHVMDRLVHIVQEEKIDYSDEGLQSVHKLSGGDMRKCLNILQVP